MERQSLNFDSKTENIVVAEKLIDEVCTKHSVNEDFYGNILIAVTEAVNNAINHGNKQNPDKKVLLEYAELGDRLSFTVKDEGDGFDHAALPDPTDPENLEKISGRGVFLMNQLADEVEFSDNGSKVEMKFKVG